MSAEPSDDRPKARESHSRHHSSRRWRVRKHPLYVFLMPYKRQLKNVLLLCGMVVLSYVVWTLLAK